MRRSIVVATALVVLALALVGGPSLLTSPTTSEVAPENGTQPEAAVEVVRPTDGESGFWPYLNSRQSFERRSPINVVIIAETDDVVRMLTEARDGDWQETDEEFEAADPGTHALVGGNESTRNESLGEERIRVGSTEIQWGPTTGASRYAYVDPGPDEAGYWIEETAQFHDGTYYGHRYHIRMYESPNPDEPWVAIQTHSEHFDWLTLRHRVAGSNRAQMRLEADLMALPQVDVRTEVSRVYLANGNASDADGWATFVDLLGLVWIGVGVGLSMSSGALGRAADRIESRLREADVERFEAVRDQVAVRHLMLAGSIIAIVLGVRIGGIALESTGRLSMHAIAALLYPFIGIGLPAGVYVIASGLDRRLDAAVVAGGSLAMAIWLDYGLLGVYSLPIDVVVQRMLVVVALGLIAGGAARRATRDSRVNDMLLGGAMLWALVMVGTLTGYF